MLNERVRILWGEYAGQYGVVKALSNKVAEVEMPDGKVVCLSPALVIQHSGNRNQIPQKREDNERSHDDGEQSTQ